jgi:hypothetical protein
MTLFEYLAVAVSIVLGLAAARLMDALPHILVRDRRYWIHAAIACVCLGNIGNSWWVMWSLRTVPEWTSVGFFLVLGASGLHYSIAALLSSSAAESVESWRDYYWEIRVRLYSLGLVWLASIAAQNLILLDVSWRHPSWLVALLGMGLMAVGAASARPRVHAFIAISMSVSLVIMVLSVFATESPLVPGGR